MLVPNGATEVVIVLFIELQVNGETKPHPSKSGLESIPIGLEHKQKEIEPQTEQTEPESEPTEPKPKPIDPKEAEPTVQWIALADERDRLAKALVDKEAEFLARERDLLDKLQAATHVAQPTKEPCHEGVAGDSVDGAKGTEVGEESWGAQNGDHIGTIVDTKDIAAASLSTTACKGDDNESENERTTALLKVEEMEAIQKEREMVILRGEQEIARLQLELQMSEDRLAQCSRQLELTRSQLTGAEERLCATGLAVQGGMARLPKVNPVDKVVRTFW